VGRGSVVVKTDDGRFMVFSVNRAAVGIPPVDPGARVRMTTAANDNDPAPTALAIEQRPARRGLAAPSNDRIPDEIQRLTSQIERQARRFRAGVIAGAVLRNGIGERTGLSPRTEIDRRYHDQLANVCHRPVRPIASIGSASCSRR
jgi:hypothetical protein